MLNGFQFDRWLGKYDAEVERVDLWLFGMFRNRREENVIEISLVVYVGCVV
jgi:hypothetical protein